MIQYWLDHPPIDQSDLSQYQHVVVDGTFLYGRRVGAVVFIDAKTKAIVAGIYGMQEGEAAMFDACRALADRGLWPVSVTTDGNPQLCRMLRTVWPHVILQRCLVHIRFQGQRWCRAKPKRPDARQLRRLFAQVLDIHTHAQRDRFIQRWRAWERRYGQRIATTPGKGRVYSDLRQARSMLARALLNMFHYLDDPNIPSTTNAAEGSFGRLKQRYAQHRGLAPQRRAPYFAWYFRLCR